uniref:Protein kinase domain-containing protein n=1 Tax=Macrostomum lignano TaxID=282301 RepID=A0A1I8FMQ4_9PLAT
LPPNAGSQTSQRLRRLCHRLVELLHPAVFAQPLTGQLGLTLLPTNGVTDAVANGNDSPSVSASLPDACLSMPQTVTGTGAGRWRCSAWLEHFAVDYASERMQLRLLESRSCEQAIESLAECLSECLAECKRSRVLGAFDWLTRTRRLARPETSAFANRSGQHDGATVWQKILAVACNTTISCLGALPSQSSSSESSSPVQLAPPASPPSSRQSPAMTLAASSRLSALCAPGSWSPCALARITPTGARPRRRRRRPRSSSASSTIAAEAELGGRFADCRRPQQLLQLPVQHNCIFIFVEICLRTEGFRISLPARPLLAVSAARRRLLTASSCSRIRRMDSDSWRSLSGRMTRFGHGCECSACRMRSRPQRSSSSSSPSESPAPRPRCSSRRPVRSVRTRLLTHPARLLRPESPSRHCCCHGYGGCWTIGGHQEAHLRSRSPGRPSHDLATSKAAPLAGAKVQTRQLRQRRPTAGCRAAAPAPAEISTLPRSTLLLRRHEYALHCPAGSPVSQLGASRAGGGARPDCREGRQRGPGRARRRVAAAGLAAGGQQQQHRAWPMRRRGCRVGGVRLLQTS